MSQTLAEDKLFITYLNQKGENCRTSYPVMLKRYVQDKVKIVDPQTSGQNRIVRSMERRHIEIDVDCSSMEALTRLMTYFKTTLKIVNIIDLDLKFEKGEIFIVRRK